MRATLVRIGIDQAYGGWNAPVDLATNEFVYVPIPEGAKTPQHPELATTYATSAFEDDARNALRAAGLPEDLAMNVWANHRGAVNQAAYVPAMYRSAFADVHGWHSAPAQIVQETLTFCVFIARSLIAMDR